MQLVIHRFIFDRREVLSEIGRRRLSSETAS